MKTFIRHLRTRATPNPSRTPKTNLISATIPTETPATLPTPAAESPTLTRPPASSPASPTSAELTHYRPFQPAPQEPPIKPPKLHLSDLLPPTLTPHAYRWETHPPSPEQLHTADTFFLTHPPHHLWSESKFKKIDFGNVPEVAFLGRSNVGKSSLLNALLNNKNLAYTSSKPGRTRLMNAFSIADGKLVLLDMPGYGHASREEWGVQIMKYLKSRKQFRRAFLLIDAKHGLKDNDLQLLEQFGQEGISFQIVLSKIDRVKQDGVVKMFEEVRDLMENGIPGANAGLGEILATSGSPAKKGEKKVGLSDLRWAVMVASGLEGLHIEK